MIILISNDGVMSIVNFSYYEAIQTTELKLIKNYYFHVDDVTHIKIQNREDK